MIIVKIQGGLGNQMFQYAAGLRLANRYNSSLKLDLSRLLDRNITNITFREFDLDIFGIVAEAPTQLELDYFKHLSNRGSWNLLERIRHKITKPHYYLEEIPDFHPEVFRLPNNTYLEGYFQDERNFVDIDSTIRMKFRLSPDESKLTLETRKLADEIKSGSSCCVHVRRGDYVTNANALRVSGICSLSYYQRGLDEIRASAAVGKVFLFSDDVAWCRENFKEGEHLVVVSDEHAGYKASTHFWLMTLCDHFVISNSSFSWWAAWLGKKPESIICRPTPWFREPRFAGAEVCPPSWRKLPRE